MERTRIHADDFGITEEQARKILALTKPLGGPLGSVSIFVNSPVFHECAQLAQPYARTGEIVVRPHINLVEGRCASDPSHVPLLVDERGMFRNDFVGLMGLAHGENARAFRLQVRQECAAQIGAFLQEFPEAQSGIELDSHQHTHMIPAVFDALLLAARDCKCAVSYIRIPVEPVKPHLESGHVRRFLSLNTAKDALLSHYAAQDIRKAPAKSAASTFSGIVLSGRMEELDENTLALLQRRADAKGGMLEVLFHPVSMRPQDCLDPQNAPFTEACCSPHRDAEAARLRAMTSR